jgi:hypothetical protein
MMECGTIRQRLSAYLEGIISFEEKKFIEEHLLSCQPCSVALRDLKRAGELVRDLKEVEPPPWMAQKVLARIRREQEGKKGIFEKLFFPLRIKIPIQATATVLIAVLAIYVFKAGEPELKKVQTPMVTDEVASKGEDLKQPSAPSAEVLAPEASTVLKEMPKLSDRRDVRRAVKEKDKEDMALSGREKVRGPSEGERRVAEEQKESPPITAFSKPGSAPPPPEAAGPGRTEDVRSRWAESGKSIRAPGQGVSNQGTYPVAGVGKTEEHGAARDSLAKERKAPAAALPLRAAVAKKAEAVSISVQVRDVRMAGSEIEDLLRQFGATRIERESIQDAEVITAELQSEKIEELIEKLRLKGEIKEKEPPLRLPKGETRIRVEILSAR